MGDVSKRKFLLRGFDSTPGTNFAERHCAVWENQGAVKSKKTSTAKHKASHSGSVKTGEQKKQKVFEPNPMGVHSLVVVRMWITE